MDLLNREKVEAHVLCLFDSKNSVLTGNNYEEGTVEWYPNRIAPHSKSLKRLVANLILGP